MRKALSLFLLLCLIITIAYKIPIEAASESFYSCSNWKIYSASTSFLNDEKGIASTTQTSITENTDKEFANGDASSLKISAKNQYVTLPINVEKNKTYIVSYKFMSLSATLGSATANGIKYNFLLNKTGVIAPDHKVNPLNAEQTYFDFITYNSSFKSENGLYSSKSDNSQRTTAWIEAKKWHSVNLTFNSGDNTTVNLTITPGVESFYVDDITLKEISTLENLDNWGIYSPNKNAYDNNYIVTPTFDGKTCQTKMGWCKISNSFTEDADGSSKSIKIYGYAFNVAANLTYLKENTEYTLSFKYKPDSKTTPDTSTNAYFTSYIIKTGTGFNSEGNGPSKYVAMLPAGTETNDWTEISISFTTDKNTDYMLAFYFNFDKGYTCFLDDFVLTQRVQDIPNIMTSYNNAAALCTASSSSTGKNGLRVYNSISKSFLINNTIIEYGSVAIRKESLKSNQLSIDFKYAAKGIAFNRTTLPEPIIYNETDKTYIFTSYLTNIPTSKYNETYLVRAYAIDSNGTVYYGDITEVCVFDIVWSIDCENTVDNSAPSDADITAFYTFANYDGNFAAYDSWLEVNNKTAGILRTSEN